MVSFNVRIAEYKQFFKTFAGKLRDALRDLLPVVLVILVFQLGVLRQPFPQLVEVLAGSVLVLVGLALFVMGLEMGLFPIGETMADALAHKGSLIWLLIFGFGLGLTTTIAEPALITVTQKAAEVAAEGAFIEDTARAMGRYALGLRLTVALAVALSIVVGLFRILKGWPVHHFIIGGYVLVMILTAFAPSEIVGVAYDSGGVTTSTVTVPLVTALGVGLSNVIQGRNPLVDGFGLIALASLFPVVFVLIYGIVFMGGG